MNDYIILALCWSLFYAVHSLMAASKLKRILKEKLGQHMKWYRLFYSLLSILLLMGIGLVSLKIPTQKILSESQFLQYFGYLFATFGTIILVKSSKGWSLMSFLGFKPVDQNERLFQSGWYARVRHPLYLGLAMIFLGYFLVAGTGAALAHFVCLALYLPIGIYFEEQNLVDQFGQEYIEYKKKVPAFFPKLKK